MPTLNPDTAAIPEEIKREAQTVCAPSYSGATRVDDAQHVLDVARALMARDQRAARKVSSLPWHVKVSKHHVRARRSDEYAAAILTYGGDDADA
ncbi:hypothetical protein [Brucella sp. IR073]|uniref:hypothetical protein n=1 Tax=unclassified Brucella TaxID=2632610 RepID=UPI003B97F74F